MRESYSYKEISDALDRCLGEGADIASKADYTLFAVVSPDGSDIDVTLESDYRESMPDIYIEPYKYNDTVWRFNTSLSFPILNYQSFSSSSFSNELENWKYVSDIVDYFQNLIFDPHQWM